LVNHHHAGQTHPLMFGRVIITVPTPGEMLSVRIWTPNGTYA
jgi:hypothetical protein